MTNRGPEDELKRYLKALKRKRIKDGREIDRRKVWTKLRNWLLSAEELRSFLYPCLADELPDDTLRETEAFGPSYWVDENTVLVTRTKYRGGYIVYSLDQYLVWRIGADFGYRQLSYAERLRVCQWSQRMLRAGLGFAPDLPAKTADKG